MLEKLTEESSSELRHLLFWGAIGGFFGLMLSVYPSVPVREVKIFQREGKPSIMRMCRRGRDSIFVYDKSKGSYIPLERYLKSEDIQSKADREIEETEIRKAAE